MENFPNLDHPLDYDGEEVLCYCGRRAARWTCWRTNPNFGRRFYNCYMFNPTRCHFFKWHDPEIEHEGARDLIMALRTAYLDVGGRFNRLRASHAALRQQAIEANANHEIALQAAAAFRVKAEHFRNLMHEAAAAANLEARKRKRLQVLIVLSWAIIIILLAMDREKQQQSNNVLRLP